MITPIIIHFNSLFSIRDCLLLFTFKEHSSTLEEVHKDLKKGLATDVLDIPESIIEC
jgi:hypothetical protein